MLILLILRKRRIGSFLGIDLPDLLACPVAAGGLGLEPGDKHLDEVVGLLPGVLSPIKDLHELVVVVLVFAVLNI